MRICIIGCGYVGKAAAIQWKKEGHEITVTTRSLERAYQLRPIADLVYILDEDWYKLLDKQDVVLLSVAPDAKSDYIQTYLRTAENLVQVVKHSSVSQIIYTGSTSIYGDHEGNWVDEQTPPQPMNANAQILLTTEHTLLKAETDQRKVCIFRLGEIYGPGRSIAERVRKMQGSSFPGNGENYTNLVHQDEILSALDYAVKQKLNGIYNLCNDIHIARKEMYQEICQAQGWPEVQWNPAVKSPHAGNKKVSNEKLKSVGWKPISQNQYSSC
jgi:nucleoside-diphosphate-sugar epimerase